VFSFILIIFYRHSLNALFNFSRTCNKRPFSLVFRVYGSELKTQIAALLGLQEQGVDREDSKMSCGRDINENEEIMNTLAVKKRYITLIEMIIVITLIGIIMGALAWRYTGALDKGRAFSTETSMARLETILNLAVAENPRLLDSIESDWRTVVEKSPLVDDPNKLIVDGWGYPFDVNVEQGEIVIRSESYENYRRDNS
jgi:general secretion pathway protein G